AIVVPVQKCCSECRTCDSILCSRRSADRSSGRRFLLAMEPIREWTSPPAHPARSASRVQEHHLRPGFHWARAEAPPNLQALPEWIAERLWAKILTSSGVRRCPQALYRSAPVPDPDCSPGPVQWHPAERERSHRFVEGRANGSSLTIWPEPLQACDS